MMSLRRRSNGSATSLMVWELRNSNPSDRTRVVKAVAPGGAVALDEALLLQRIEQVE